MHAHRGPQVHEHARWFNEYHALMDPLERPQPIRERLEHEVARLLAAHAAGKPAAAVPRRFYTPHLRNAPLPEILAVPLEKNEARLVVAQTYLFDTWDACTRSSDVVDPGFEAAVDAVVQGDLPALEAALAQTPDLVRARSAFGHRSTLLHYVAANGVEIRRQLTPPNIVDVARRLLVAGAEPDALSGAYGGGPNQTPLCLTVSSCHPAEAGLQIDLAETLLDGGAALEGVENDGMPLATALAFGYPETARHLVERGARVDNLVIAAGLGRRDLVEELLDRFPQRYVDPFGPVLTERQQLLDRAFYQAAQQQHLELVRRLLDAGADVNTTGTHARIALHWVAHAGHGALVELLLERGADRTRRDTYYDATPADWAREGGHHELAERLAL